MDVFETIFAACCAQAATVFPPEIAGNTSYIDSVCRSLTDVAMSNHQQTGVLDFEVIASVVSAWWINGLLFLSVMLVTVVLNALSIYIFLDVSMRSPTNILLIAITALDLLTCLCHSPLNIHAYFMENYKELPSYVWCGIYLYVHNFLPSTFHSAAFLLNMYLSVQRCVGVKDIRRCHFIGTYKGSVSAISTCAIISFAIHSLYPASLAIEEVTAISKKVLSASGIYFIQSCRVVPRYPDEYRELYSAYLWLRVAVLQLLPGFVLCACNVVLIQASYSTYTYRKRLVGTVGTISDYNQDLKNNESVDTNPRINSPTTVSGVYFVQVSSREVPECKNDGRTTTVGGQKSPSSCSDVAVVSPSEGLAKGRTSKDISVVDCFEKKTVLANFSANMDRNFCHRRPKYECHLRSIQKSAKVAPTDDLVKNAMSADVRADAIRFHGHTAQTEPALFVVLHGANGTHKLAYDSRELFNDQSDDKLCLSDHRKSEFEFHVRKHTNENKTSPQSNNGQAPKFTIMANQNAKSVQSSEDSYFTRGDIDDLSRLDTVHHQMATGDDEDKQTILRLHHCDSRFHSKLASLSCCRLPELMLNISPLDTVIGESSVCSDSSICNRSMNSSSENYLNSGVNSTRAPLPGSLSETHPKIRNNNNSRTDRIHRFPRWMRQASAVPHCASRSSAEIRSSIMLILVTSCTLVAEVFVSILLIFTFVNTAVDPNNEPVNNSDLAILIMISNIMVLISFPLNFFFFCGLSHAFRSALRIRLRMLVGRFSRNFRQT